MPAAGDGARAFFEGAGFDVGPTVGTSFSIAGPRALMETTFPGFQAEPGELSLEGLPAEVRQELEAVVIERPPDYGPTNP